MVPVYYSEDYTASRFAFDTTRKSRFIAESLVKDPIPGIVLRKPVPLEADEIARVHNRDYIRAVREGEPHHLAQSQGFDWDPGIWTMVTASNGGAVDAATWALANGGVAGSLSSGLHHATGSHGAGFCTFNGIALAEAEVRRSDRMTYVHIVDLDAHCGGGTHDLLADNPFVSCTDVSVSEFDHYTPCGGRWTLDIVKNADEYLPTIQRRLAAAPNADLIIYNAGMDPYQGGRIGRAPGITEDVLREREQMVFSWAKGRNTPLAFVIAGGYTDMKTLVRLHRLTLEAAVR